jgi:hypothetical protein
MLRHESTTDGDQKVYPVGTDTAMVDNRDIGSETLHHPQLLDREMSR